MNSRPTSSTCRIGFACLFVVLCALGGCGASGDDEVADSRTDGTKLSADDKAAADFIRSQLAEHWVKNADGWTTEFQLRNVFGQVMAGIPNIQYKQYRQMTFTLSPETPTEAMKLNGSDYRAVAGFKRSPVRIFRTEADYEGPQGWSNWKDDYLENLAVERRNGKWIISDATYFEGIRPNGTVPTGSGT